MNKYLITLLGLLSLSMTVYSSNLNGDYIKAAFYSYEIQLEKDLFLLNQLEQRNSIDLDYQALQVRCKILYDKKEMYEKSIKFRYWGGEKYLKALEQEIITFERKIKKTTGKSVGKSC